MYIHKYDGRLAMDQINVESGFGKVPIIISTDSKAAYDSLKKSGPGRLKYVELRWQDAVRNQVISLKKIPGETNRWDSLTNAVDRQTLSKHMSGLNASRMCAVVVAQIVAVDGTSSELACQSGTEVSPVELGELGTMFSAKFGTSNSVIAAATLSVLCVFCFGFGCGLSVGIGRKPEQKNKQVQSQTSYTCTMDNVTPRFKPLAEHNAGRWEW